MDLGPNLREIGKNLYRRWLIRFCFLTFWSAAGIGASWWVWSLTQGKVPLLVGGILVAILAYALFWDGPIQGRRLWRILVEGKEG